MEASGIASQQRLQCLDAVAHTPGATAREIEQRIGIKAHKRLPELRRSGAVRNGKSRICKVTGHYDAKKHSLLSPQVESEQPVKKFIKLPGKVFTDADDTTPGFLNDEIIVDPPNGDPSWLEKSVEPGGAADNKLLIEHKDWDSARVEDTVHSLMSWEDNGGGLYLDISQPSEGWAWINIEVWRHTRDRKGHCDLISRQPDPVPLDPIYLKWVAVPMGNNVGDMLYWDGDKWVTLAAPSGGDFVLMSSGAAPYWQQVQEFECPGTSGGS